MDVLEFRKDFIETVKSIALVDKDFRESAFVSVAANKLIEAEEIEDFELCYYEGTGRRNRRLRVDGYSFDVDDSVKLFISHYNGEDDTNTLTQSEAERVFSRLQGFVEEAFTGGLHWDLEESSPGYGLAYELYKNRDSIRCFKLYLLSDSILSSRVKALPAGSISNLQVEYNIWDISRFHRVSESASGRDELSINFQEFIEDGIPCLEAGQTVGDYKAYLCIIPGGVLAEIYNRYGSRLLEGNVRSFLSNKGKVNKGIRVTIKSKPEMFFAFNNGISTTATDATIVQTKSGLRLMNAKDLQIVNGGQTTASLLMAKLKDRVPLDNIYVQMKISVVSPVIATEIIPEIARCANSQNKVSEADFFSNHQFHIRFESFSRRIWAPSTRGSQLETHWFYERARGQYLNEQAKMTPSEKDRFEAQNPRKQVITKTDLAKFHISWLGLPHKVSLGAQKNFQLFADWVSAKWAKSDTEFNEDFYRESIALAILFKRTEELVSAQSWYQGGYRANIVTYSIAKLSNMVKVSGKGKTLDLRSIWNRQGISPAIVIQLEIIAKDVFEVIVSPKLGFQNVTEWCKKEYCWELIKNLNIDLLEELRAELVDLQEIKEKSKQSINQQKMDNGIDAQVMVVNFGAEYWQNIASWGKLKHLITGEEEKLLNIACRISTKLMPSDRQSLKLLAIKERLEEEGFIA